MQTGGLQDTVVFESLLNVCPRNRWFVNTRLQLLFHDAVSMLFLSCMLYATVQTVAYSRYTPDKQPHTNCINVHEGDRSNNNLCYENRKYTQSVQRDMSVA
jgi:hypothetical protein